MEDVYTGKECIKGNVIGWHAYPQNLGESVPVKTSDGKYIYFDGSTYPNIEYKTTDTILEQQTGENRMHRYYYAYYTPGREVNFCRSNANSYAVLMEVKKYWS